VCDVSALRRIRGQRRPFAHHRPGDDHDDVDERRHDDDHVRTHRDRTHDHQHRPPGDADHHGGEVGRDDHAPHRPHDRHHREEGRADDRLHSSDDRAGHDDDGLFVDAVRTGDLLLGP